MTFLKQYETSAWNAFWSNEITINELLMKLGNLRVAKSMEEEAA